MLNLLSYKGQVIYSNTIQIYVNAVVRLGEEPVKNSI